MGKIAQDIKIIGDGKVVHRSAINGGEKRAVSSTTYGPKTETRRRGIDCLVEFQLFAVTITAPAAFLESSRGGSPSSDIIRRLSRDLSRLASVLVSQGATPRNA